MDGSLTRLQLASIICTPFAIAITLIRLFVRRKKLWVDDFFAIGSMGFLITQMGVILDHGGRMSTFAYAYVVMSMFYATVWSARISILFTILRVGGGRRQILCLSLVVVVFVLFWGVLTGQLFWTCDMERRHALTPISSCSPGRQTAILSLIADILADSTLLVSSLRLFRAIQERGLRHRLKLIFSTCMCTTLASMVHASLILQGKARSVTWIAALVEACVSLMVSSLPVILNMLIRLRPDLFHYNFPYSMFSASCETQRHTLGSLSFAPSPHLGTQTLDDMSTVYDAPSLLPKANLKPAKYSGKRQVPSDLARLSIPALPVLPRTDDPGTAPVEPPPIYPISPYQ